MTVGGWCCMTFAYAFIGGLFCWCCLKMRVAADEDGVPETSGANEN